MVDQSRVGIARPAVDRALVLEYQDMLTGKSSKLSKSQSLQFSGQEIQKVRQLPDDRVSQNTRLVVSKDNASFRAVVHRYVCFEPVPAALRW